MYVLGYIKYTICIYLESPNFMAGESYKLLVFSVSFLQALAKRLCGGLSLDYRQAKACFFLGLFYRTLH